MVDLVIIGHLGLSEDRSPHGKALTPGGAGYACARGATVTDPRRVGLVAVVGDDYDFEPVKQFGIDLHGIQILDGDSPRFSMLQHSTGDRTFSADMGVASQVMLSAFPPRYRRARHIHIATSPPSQQLEWLGFLRKVCPQSTISIDSFEYFAHTHAEASRQVCRSADLVFMNAEERCLLFADAALPDVPVVVKNGPEGAEYHHGGHSWQVATMPVEPVDTTGAGEILAGVFLALRIDGCPPQIALRYAVHAATAKVAQFGVDGRRLLDELADIRAHVCEGRHLAPSGLPTSRGCHR